MPTPGLELLPGLCQEPERAPGVGCRLSQEPSGGLQGCGASTLTLCSLSPQLTEILALR